MTYVSLIILWEVFCENSWYCIINDRNYISRCSRCFIFSRQKGTEKAGSTAGTD